MYEKGVNDRNLTLKFARAELGILELKGGDASSTKIVGGNEKGNPRKTEFQMKQITIPIKGNYPKGEPPVKRLLDTKFRARLDKGLCFICNEIYSHGHRCKVKEKRELMLFIFNEEEGAEGVIVEIEEDIVELKNLEVPVETEIELKTIMGFAA